MKRFIVCAVLGIAYLAAQITYHPITKWVCDGNKNKISYFHYDESMIHINIEKEFKFVDETHMSKKHLNIWVFFCCGVYDLQWLDLKETRKLETI